MTIYISGPISGQEGYRMRFSVIEQALEQKGWRVINPAKLPEGLSRREYMLADLTQLLICDAAFFMHNYMDSEGAGIEHSLAGYAHLECYYALADVPDLTEGWFSDESPTPAP